MKYTPKEKPCKFEGCENTFTPRFRTTEMFCSKRCEISHKNSQETKPRKRINRVSVRRAKEEREYSKKRKQFLQRPENMICPVTGKRTNEIHHKKGRVGDLFLDENYWLAVHSEGHEKIENNPEWAKEMGYSISRLSDG